MLIMYPMLCGWAYGSDEALATIVKFCPFISLASLAGVSLVRGG